MSSDRKDAVILLGIYTSKNDILKRIHAKCTGTWWGCNWPTSFGPLELDLNNLRSRQARLMADATSGKESEAWHAAALYLTQLEIDAAAAEKLAAEAIKLTELERWGEALKLIAMAVELEARYRPSETWQPMWDGIASKSNLN